MADKAGQQVYIIPKANGEYRFYPFDAEAIAAFGQYLYDLKMKEKQEPKIKCGAV